MRKALLLIVVSATVARAQDRPDLQVAVTFDDVPAVAVAHCGPGVARALNTKLLAAIARNRMPATAFVVAGDARCGGSELGPILRDWVAAGHDVGSHTFTHRDINVLRLEQYIRDVDAAHTRLTALLRPAGRSVRYFRHPFLHMGETPEKKAGLDRHLRRKGYTIGVVTVDNQEWIFAGAYARAQAAGDSALARRIVPAYLAHLDSSFAYYEGLSEAVFGRQIRQVLLLHANQLNADHLDDVARIIRGRGYRFISLPAALEDSAYRRPDTYVGPAGMSWLQRWAIAGKIKFRPEPREPVWLQEP